MEIIAALGSAAERFNAAHQDDLCSANDLLDVLQTARARIVQATKAEAAPEPVPA